MGPWNKSSCAFVSKECGCIKNERNHFTRCDISEHKNYIIRNAKSHGQWVHIWMSRRIIFEALKRTGIACYVHRPAMDFTCDETLSGRQYFSLHILEYCLYIIFSPSLHGNMTKNYVKTLVKRPITQNDFHGEASKELIKNLNSMLARAHMKLTQTNHKKCFKDIKIKVCFK